MSKKTVHGLHHGSRAPKLFVTQGGKSKPLPEEVEEFIQAISLERTIDVGSTLSVTARDPNHVLAQQGYFVRNLKSKQERPKRADLFLPDPEGTGGLWFRASTFEKITGDEFKLDFEDREVAFLREYFGPPFKMTAGKLKNPRAVFIKRLVHKAAPHVKFVCPELEKKQLVIVKHAKTKGHTLHRGIKSKKRTDIEGAPMDPEQVQNAETILAVCDELNAPHLAYVAILCAAIQESKLHHTAENSAHAGVFQAVKGHYNTSDVATEARAWLTGGRDFQSGGGKAYALAHPKASPGTVAEAVEASGTQEISNYDKHRLDAEEILSSYGGSKTGGGTGAAASTGTTERSSFVEQRFFEFPKHGAKEGSEPESAWECASAYAKEINWRFFSSAGRIFLVSDEHLEKAEVAMELDEDTPGVTDVKWQIDYNAKKNPPRLEIDCRAPIWTAGPSTPIIMGKKQGAEIHEGLWIVSMIRRPDITDNAVTITLERPKKPLAEHLVEPHPKAAETPISLPNMPGGSSGTTSEGGHNAGVAGAHEPVLEKIVFQANWITSHHFPYVYGGGHNPSNFNPTTGAGFSNPFAAVGYDCSGAVSALLGPAGLLTHPYETNGLEFWGQPGGGGSHIVVWVHPRFFPYNFGHTFMEFVNVSGAKATAFAYHSSAPGSQNGWKSVGSAGASHTDSPLWKARHWEGL